MEEVGGNKGFIGPLGNWLADIQTSAEYNHYK